MKRFKNAQKALRKYISENKDKVRQDLSEMQKRSENSNNVTVSEYIELVKNLNVHNVSSSLSVEQLERADMWYCLHKNHVNKLYHLADKSFPPTLNEDKNNPNLWKAGHWKWYLENYR